MTTTPLIGDAVNSLLANALLYVPLLGILTTFSLARSYTFKRTFVGLLVATTAYTGIVLYLGLAWYIVLLQLVSAVVLAIIVLGVLGKKASGETLGILVGVVLLFPFVARLSVLSFAIMVLVGAGVTLVIGLRRWQQYTMALKGGDKTTLNSLLWQAGVDSGLASKTLPTAESLPDRRLMPSQAKVSAAPWFLLGAAVATLVTTLV